MVGVGLLVKPKRGKRGVGRASREALRKKGGISSQDGWVWGREAEASHECWHGMIDLPVYGVIDLPVGRMRLTYLCYGKGSDLPASRKERKRLSSKTGFPAAGKTRQGKTKQGKTRQGIKKAIRVLAR